MKKFFDSSFPFLNSISRALQSLKIAFDAVRDWTDPATESTPYLPFERISEKKTKLTEKKALFNRKWAIN